MGVQGLGERLWPSPMGAGPGPLASGAPVAPMPAPAGVSAAPAPAPVGPAPAPSFASAAVGVAPAGPAGPAGPGEEVQAGDLQRFQDLLSGHIEECFRVAKSHKDSHITPILLDCLRRRKGEYDATTLSEIRQSGGTEIYFNLTETKCAALEAWVEEVFGQAEAAQDRSWTLKKGEISTLPPDVQQGILDAVVEDFLEEYRAVEAAAAGMPPAEAAQALEQLAQRVQQSAVEIAQAVKEQAEDEAKERAEEMTLGVADLLNEGGWDEALAGFIHQMATFPAAVIKGPVLQGKRRQYWEADGATASVVDEPIPTFSNPSIFDIYPSPSARRIGDDWLIEVVRFSIADLETEATGPGWIQSRVQAVIAEYLRSSAPPATADTGNSARADLEVRPLQPLGYTTIVEALEWWGPVPGKFLLDWAAQNERTLDKFGLTGIREDRWYPITALYMGKHVVKVGPVPDPLGALPYDAASFETVPGSLWGRSIPEKLKDIQDAYNGCGRGLINNIAFATGPMISYDVNGGTPPARVYPRMVILYNGSKTGGRNPIGFHHPQSNAEAFLSVGDDYEQQADDRVGIPKYVYGSNSRIGGAGETAAGLAMLLGQGAKGVKRVVGFIDKKIQTPVLTRVVRFCNKYSSNPKLKGDVRVEAHGALRTLTKDTAAMRQNEFLGVMGNPAFARFFTEEGTALVLRALAERNDLPGDKIVKTERQLAIEATVRAQMEQAALAAGAQSQPGGGDGGKPNQNGPALPKPAAPNQIRPAE